MADGYGGGLGVAESLCLLVSCSLRGAKEVIGSAWGGAGLETTFFPLAQGKGISPSFRSWGEQKQKWAYRRSPGIGQLCGLGPVAGSLSLSAHPDPGSRTD